MNLPAGHPALTAKGNLTKKAKTILARKPFKSRNRRGRFISKSPVRNTELFYHIADIVETFPERYDQETWVNVVDKNAPYMCGTHACIAGNALLATEGYKMGKTYWGEDFIAPEIPGNFNNTVEPNAAVETNAAIELGLTGLEAENLFGREWLPANGLSVAQALRALGDGARVEDVTNEAEFYTENRIRVSGRRPQ